MRAAGIPRHGGVFGVCLLTCYFLEMIAGFSVLIIASFFPSSISLLSFSSTVILYPLTWVRLWLLLIGIPPDTAMPGFMMRNRGLVSSYLGMAWDDSWRWRHGNSGESNDLVLC